MRRRRSAISAVVLISGGGSNLQALIDARETHAFELGIEAVISNRPDAFGLERARRAGIPAFCIDHREFGDRAAFESALAARIGDYTPDLLLLAGFMRILTPAFVTRFQGRILNIHPSLLPKYPGLDTHRRALDAGDAWHGATVHFVTAELDRGPAVMQARVPVHPDDDADTLARRVLEREHRLYPAAVKLIAEGRLEWREERAWLDGAPLTAPILYAEETGTV